MDDLELLDRLARKYKEKGEASGNWTDYLKAHGLANACVIKESTEARLRLVYEIEKSWYKGKHPLSFTQHQDLISEHKRLLHAYRSEMSTKFRALATEADALDWDDIFSEENVKRASQFSQNVFSANKVCSDDFVHVSKCIMESSIEILKKTGIVAPCHFAVIGLGSIAKGEATPYSDLEYAFIVKFDDEYFTILAMDSYFRLGNLGESPLKGFDINELKVEKGCPPLVKEDGTIGYRIDGISKSAGNIPTGNGKAKGLRLISSVDGFMELYKEAAESPFEGMAGDKSDMLSSTVLIYSNEGEDSGLYQDYLGARMAYETSHARENVNVVQKRIISFVHDMKSYTFLPEFVKYQPPNNLHIKIKTDIFRYPTLLANNLKMCMGLKSSRSWEVYSELHGLQEVLPDEAYQALNIVLALSIYIRTSIYIVRKSQAEIFALDVHSTETVPYFHLILQKLFIVLGCFLVPIKQSIVKRLSKMENDLQPAILIRDLVVNKADFMTKVAVLYFFGDYRSALMELSHGISQSIEKTKPDQLLTILGTKYGTLENKSKTLELCSYLLYNTQSYASAADYINRLITTKTEEENLGFWKLLLAHCMKELGDYQSSKQLLDEATGYLKKSPLYANSLTFLEDLYGAKSSHHDIAANYNNIGLVYQQLGMYELCLEYYIKALEVMRSLYNLRTGILDAASNHNVQDAHRNMEEMRVFLKEADIVYHPYIATAFNNIGATLGHVGQHSLALDYLVVALQIKRNLHPGENHPCIADTYVNIGVLYSDIGEYDSALKCYSMALEILKVVHGSTANHPLLATCYENLGNIHNRMGNYSAAVEYCTKSLMIKQAIFGVDADHPDIANSLHNIADSHFRKGEYALALEYHTKAMTMSKAVYGANTNHPDIANSLNSIGSTYMSMGKFGVALEHFTKSLEMKKVLFGDVNHRDMANCYHNIGAVCRQMGKINEALANYTTALEIRKALYGDANHPSIAMNYTNIGNVYNMRKEFSTSLEYHNKALDMLGAIYGAHAYHPELATCHHNIAITYDSLGKHKDALEHYAKSLEMQKVLYGGVNHPGIAASYNNLGSTYSDMENYVKALDCCNKSLEIMKAIYGNANHPDIASSYRCIADIYIKMEKFVEAVKYCNEALEMDRAIHGDTNNAVIASDYSAIGDVYAAEGEYTTALDNYFKSLEILKAMHGNSNDTDLAGVYASIADVYSAKGEHAIALEHYLKSLQMLKAIHNETNDASVAKLYGKVGQTYLSVSEYTAALEHCKQSLDIYLTIHGDEAHDLDIATAYEHVGHVCREMGDCHDALECYIKSLNMRTVIYESDKGSSNSKLMCYFNIGGVYVKWLNMQKT